MKKQEKKRRVGRPSSENPRVKLPSVVIKLSNLEGMKDLADRGEMSLSYHFDKAVEYYLDMMDRHKKRVIRL